MNVKTLYVCICIKIIYGLQHLKTKHIKLTRAKFLQPFFVNIKLNSILDEKLKLKIKKRTSNIKSL